MADNTREELARGIWDTVKYDSLASSKIGDPAQVTVRRIALSIRSEISKAQEQLLDELETEAITFVSLSSNPFDGAVVPVAVIEAKRKEIKSEG